MLLKYRKTRHLVTAAKLKCNVKFSKRHYNDTTPGVVLGKNFIQKLYNNKDAIRPRALTRVDAHA